MSSALLSWLDNQHEVHKANCAMWEREERRLRGGVDVLAELVPFDWEDVTWDQQLGEHVAAPGGHYEMRQKQATYPAFGELFASGVMGHLMEKAPQPGSGLDFGTLGSPTRVRGASTPSQAELVYWNVDGVGNDGSQWENWWTGVGKRAFATGHRWIYVEAPAEFAGNRLREASGFRPYLKEFSPTQVTDWHYEHGKLAYAVVRVSRREPKVEQGRFTTGKAGSWYLLLVRKGYTGLDDGEFLWSRGGWFLLDPDKNAMDEGSWDKTGGQIPLFPLFYERDSGSSVRPSISRSALHSHGQISVSYMNLSSAADFDAWDAAKSEKYALGVDKDGWALMMEQKRRGSTMIPVLVNNETNGVPTIYDGSSGAVAGEVFDLALTRKRTEAREISAREVSSTPDSSGVSKQAGFGENKSPRLALIASELENAQNTAIYFLELRFGYARPSGSVEWPRKFELTPLLEDIREMFELEALAVASSPTLKARSLVLAAREKGLIADDKDAEKILKEYEDNIQQGAADAEAQRQALLDAQNSDQPPALSEEAP